MLIGARRVLLSRAAAVVWAAETLAFFARLSTPPSDARKLAYNTLISALVSAGVWSKLDILYLFAAADAATALSNLIQASYGATAVNAPTFAVDQGYTGNGTSSYVSSNFAPLTAGGDYAQDSASLGVWDGTSGTIAVALAGIDNGHVSLYPNYTGSVSYLRLNDNALAGAFGTAGTPGWFAANRSSSTARQGYRNGSSIGSYPSNTSIAIPAGNVLFGAGMAIGGAYSTHQFKAGVAGASLSATEHLALYNALHGYLHTVAGIA